MESEMFSNTKSKADRYIKMTTSYLKQRVQTLTLIIFIVSLLLSLILIIIAKTVSEDPDTYYLISTYTTIISIILCLILFINFCINNDNTKI